MTDEYLGDILKAIHEDLVEIISHLSSIEDSQKSIAKSLRIINAQGVYAYPRV